ncbi:MAG: hypothetical protein ACOX9C_06700 [Kiritimatiellia bacterium]|jgi:hypothetical protein
MLANTWSSVALSFDSSRPAPTSPLRRGIENSIRLVLIVFLVPYVVFLDLYVFGNRLKENSVTEWGQALILLVCVILFARVARRRPDGRGWYMLISGFFTCCLIREMDWIFDKGLFHGAWAPFAIAVALVVIVRSLRIRHTLVPGAVEFFNTQAFVYVQIGLVVLLFLSRFLGSGQLIWYHIGHDRSFRLCKSVIQESLELFGYLLIFFGSILLHSEFDRDNTDPRQIEG